ncbi:MAG TPA: DUF86 domain-containing protein [Ferruginibacter sp.]|nr:DUF86 domain-containing protein [Chitinophagaceae bacterium]HML58955.1 DUF86 domain-containing protein [Ferruginibacter sp.]HRO06674.1 DUF86 domain-containing protein [Ferruginibacter sp.]HRO96327.1 DUF86 domain-containing protein [Ferruginibacter sp.]HRP48432.1 DUF86 domain-containing protein [Ferruginibacter sp.]
MKSKMGDRQRLLHILESIEEIEQYTSKANFSSFLENSMMRFACVKQMEIIGEAANNISEETKNKFSKIQWRQIIGLRHILVHEYFGIDTNLIWQIIANDIPQLKESIQKVLEQLDKK